MALLYHWQRENYVGDIARMNAGVELELQQSSPAFAAAAPNERLWAFTRHADNSYRIAAQVHVSQVLAAPDGSYGQYRAQPRPGSTVLYDVEGGQDVEGLIRGLSISAAAAVLGQSFQGGSAVRRITDEDDAQLQAFTLHLPVLWRTDAPLTRVLRLYEKYTRKEIHDIFGPGTPFHRGAGKWGIPGIISIPDRPGDFLFLVTFGQKQGEHTFEEEVTEGGVLTWQSQPAQTLLNRQIRQFVRHDENLNSIYLFLRTSEVQAYTYLGQLAYVTHDEERETPVHFKWQIIPAPIPPDVAREIGLELTSGESVPPEAPSGAGLEETPPPLSGSAGETTRLFRARRRGDRAEQDARNRALGRAGELLILERERGNLTQAGRPDLLARVRHVAEIEGDGAGYDIESVHLDGKAKYIEVKATRGPISTPFFMSANELAFAKTHASNYVLCRVYDYLEKGSGKFYVCEGDPGSFFNLEPIQFRARPGPTGRQSRV